MGAPAPQYTLFGEVLDGRFLVQGRSPDGQNGLCYSGVDQKTSQPVAIKVLHLPASTPAGEAVSSDVGALSALVHPRLAPFFARGVCLGQTLFLVREWLDGHFLDEEVSHNPLAPARVLEVLIAVCEGLAVAHAAGRAHGNVAASNVFVGRPESRADPATEVRLVDFAVGGRVVEEGWEGWRVNASYRAPELRAARAGAAATSPAGDLFAVGVLAHLMLAGQLPQHPGPPLEVAPSLVALVRRAMADDPAKRHKSATELADECRAVAAQLSRTQLLAARDREPPPPSPQLPAFDVPMPTNYSPPPQRPTFEYAPEGTTAARLRDPIGAGETRNIGMPPGDPLIAPKPAEPLPPHLSNIGRTPEPPTNIGRPPITEIDIRPTNIGRPPWSGPPPARSRRPIVAAVAAVLLAAAAWLVWHFRG